MKFFKNLFSKKNNNQYQSPTLFVNVTLLNKVEYFGKLAIGSLQENLNRESTVVFAEENMTACTVIPMSQVKSVEFYYHSSTLNFFTSLAEIARDLSKWRL